MIMKPMKLMILFVTLNTLITPLIVVNEDVSEYFCDEHLISGEQFYVMMKALVDCKLKEFPLDFDQLEEDIYDE